MPLYCKITVAIVCFTLRQLRSYVRALQKMLQQIIGCGSEHNLWPEPYNKSKCALSLLLKYSSQGSTQLMKLIWWRQSSRKRTCQCFVATQMLQPTTRWQLPLLLHSYLSSNQHARRCIVDWPGFSSVFLTSANPSFLPSESWDVTSANSVTFWLSMIISHTVLVLGTWMVRSV